MNPLPEPSANLAQPLLYGTSVYSRQFNDKHALTDFPDRHLSQKNKQVRVICTEESLDNWHAQSLGISADRLIKTKKFLTNLKPSNKKKDAGAGGMLPGTEDDANDIPATTLAQQIEKDRPAGYANKIQYFDDLQPAQYQSFHKVKSEVLMLDQKKNNHSAAALKKRQTKLEQELKKENRLRQEAEDAKKQKQKLASEPGCYSLMKELGGFQYN